jgi:TusA-related sulfurtransferase
MAVTMPMQMMPAGGRMTILIDDKQLKKNIQIFSSSDKHE